MRLQRVRSRIILLILLVAAVRVALGQQVYDNFEGKGCVRYDLLTAGRLDTVPNPASSGVNSSAQCAKYVRSGQRYDNIKMKLSAPLTNVTDYATHLGTPPRFKMKIYTTAPVGTLVEIQLGKQGARPYPAGIHSQYQAFTTVTGKWEELEFIFSQVPAGSATAAADVDQIILLFNPYFNSPDTFYFDELTGPSLKNSVTLSEK